MVDPEAGAVHAQSAGAADAHPDRMDLAAVAL